MQQTEYWHALLGGIILVLGAWRFPQALRVGFCGSTARRRTS